MESGGEQHGPTHRRILLVILAQAAVATPATEALFDDPTARQHGKAYPVFGFANDLDRPKWACARASRSAPAKPSSARTDAIVLTIAQVTGILHFVRVHDPQYAKLPSVKTGSETFALFSKFTLGASSNGINPVTEPVTFAIANFTTTIPAESFRKGRLGVYAFAGKIDNAWIEALIAPLGGNRFGFQVAAYGASLSGAANPVTVGLTIGDDQGTTSVNAAIIK